MSKAWIVGTLSVRMSSSCHSAEHVVNPSNHLTPLDSPDLLLLEVGIKSGLGVLQVSKLDGGEPGLDDGPQAPKEVGCQRESVDLNVKLLLQFHLVLFTQVDEPSVRLAQVTFNEMELLGLCRVAVGTDSEERKLIAVVVVHPLTEVVANIKSPVIVAAVLKVNEHQLLFV